MKNKNPYTVFDKYVLRTPMFPIAFYISLLGENEIRDEKIMAVLENPLVLESIFLASPELYEQVLKWKAKDIKEDKKRKRIKIAVLKYIARMSTRCTPFGLFAGFSLGHFSEKSEIFLNQNINFKKNTEFDMNYTVSLAQHISTLPEIQKSILYFPNSSLYSIGNFLRYVEYWYTNGNRKHQVTEVDLSSYLEMIIKEAKEGKTLQELSKKLVDDEITQEQANYFINELVESQILVSELEPSVSGPQLLEHIIKVIKKSGVNKLLVRQLIDLKVALQNLDKKIGSPINSYLDLLKQVENFGVDFNPKFLFQTNLNITCKKNTLTKEIGENARKTLTVFNMLTQPEKNDNLEGFKELFVERYEDREMPLLSILDVESGIGYRKGDKNRNITPLIDDIKLFKKDVIHTPYLKSKIDDVLNSKVLEALQKKERKVSLKLSDFEFLECSWQDLSPTISGIVEILSIEGESKLKMTMVSGSSSGKFLARFCHSDKELETFVKQIVNWEESQINDNQILAEIIHLPEARVGNVLMRPSFRSYEIPYLSRTTKRQKQVIYLDDLFVSIRNGAIFLRSKSLDKEVIPRLTTAHNFSSNSLPVYHFLCDLQFQGIRPYLTFPHHKISSHFKFIPRFEYDGVILSEATWKLSKEDFKPLILVREKEQLLKSEALSLQKKYQIPDFFLVVESDNKLLINIKNITSLQMFVDTIKSKSDIKLVEFLFDIQEGISRSFNNQVISNQIVISFKNTG